MGEKIKLIPNVSSLAATTPGIFLPLFFGVAHQHPKTEEEICDRGNKKKQ